MAEKYSHLNLKQWPFIIAPDEEYCKIWAGRKHFKDDIDFFLQSLERRPMSSIRLMWAWVGSGKSHTLKHIAYKCKTEHKDIIPVYLPFPKSTKSFLDLYKLIMQSINIEDYLKIIDRNFSSKYLNTFIRVMNIGNPADKDLALEWIRGERINLTTLKSIGINYRIEDTETCVKILSEIIKLIVAGKEEKMFLLMIDEIQRIGQMNKKQIESMNAALHTLFNDSPQRLTMLLSFSVRQQNTMFALLSPEMKSRSDIQNIFELNSFDEKEAKEFIIDLLNIFKIDRENPLPFNDFSINYLIKFIKNKKDYELTPRDIIAIFHDVLARADFDILKKKIDIIDEKYAKSILEQGQ